MKQNKKQANVSSIERYGKKVENWSSSEWTRFYWEEVAPELIAEYDYHSDCLEEAERYFKGPYFSDIEVMKLACYSDIDFDSSIFFIEKIDFSIVGGYPPVYVRLLKDLRMFRRVMALNEAGLPVPREIESMTELDAIEWARYKEYYLGERNANAAERAAMARDFDFLLTKFSSSPCFSSFEELLELVRKTKLDKLASVILSIDAGSIISAKEFISSEQAALLEQLNPNALEYGYWLSMDIGAYNSLDPVSKDLYWSYLAFCEPLPLPDRPSYFKWLVLKLEFVQQVAFDEFLAEARSSEGRELLQDIQNQLEGVYGIDCSINAPIWDFFDLVQDAFFLGHYGLDSSTRHSQIEAFRGHGWEWSGCTYSESCLPLR